MKNKKVVGVIVLILGILMIVFGVYGVARPSAALETLVVAFGIIAILSGIVEIVFYARIEKRTGMGPALSIIAGILSIIAGILLVCNIAAGTLVVTILFPIWFLSRCISGLANLSLTRMISGTAAYWLSLIVNILGLFLGIMLIFNPMISYLSAGTIAALYLVIIGISNMTVGITLMSNKES